MAGKMLQKKHPRAFSKGRGRALRVRDQRGVSARIVGALVSVCKFFARALFALTLAVVTFVLATLAFVIFTPEISIPSTLLSKGLTYLPSTVKLQWADIGIEIKSLPGPRLSGLKFPGTLFTKHIYVHADKICVEYAAPAVNTCFDHIQTGATLGLPGLIAIDPLLMLKGQLAVDVTAFPAADPNEPPSKFSVLDLLRNQILPKWNLQGSRVELAQMHVHLKDDDYSARLELTTHEGGEALRLALDQFSARSGLVAAGGLVRVLRGGEWSSASAGLNAKAPWKLVADAHALVQRKMRFDLLADASILNWKDVDFRVQAKTKGVPALREARVEAKYRGSKVDGLLSLKIGEAGSEVKALDFVNCQVAADLDEKTGGLQCGPQSVHLKVREVTSLLHPELFVLAPSFDLKISKIDFGPNKSGDVSLEVGINHLGLLGLTSHFSGHFEQKTSQPLKYALAGQAHLMNRNFESIVALLRTTPFSVPAPLNTLSGKIALDAELSVDQTGGSVHYALRPDLDSKYQAVHLQLNGETDYLMHPENPKSQTELATDLSLLVESLKISAPRFDLALPPQLMPDSRFHPLLAIVSKPTTSAGTGAALDLPMSDQKSSLRGEVASGKRIRVASPVAVKSNPMRFRIRIQSASPQSIQIATNLTKTIVPIELDLTYDKGQWTGMQSPSTQSSAVALANVEGRRFLTPASPLVTEAKVGEAKTEGWVRVGETKLDLFKRDATLDHLRIDFLPDGGERLEGRAGVHYLQYDIAILVNGDVAHPAISFMSRPSLDDQRQIISVLLFGHEMKELNGNDKQSVSNVQAALADAALGASSLYLLASTPIESVGYDPSKQSLTATVGIGGGASVEVGTSQEVGFNKVLSREFTFRTEVNELGDQGERTVEAMIEWVKGF